MVRPSRVCCLTLAAGLMLALSGCSQAGGLLTDSQRQAINSVSRMVNAFGTTVSTFSRVANVNTLLGGALGSSGSDPCPRINARQGFPELSVNFDYGNGCENAAVGTLVAGGVGFGVNLLQGDGFVRFDRLALANQPVSGSLRVKPLTKLTDLRFDRLRLTADDLRVGDIGTIRGPVDVDINGGALAITDSDVTFADILNTSFGVTLRDLVIDPSRNGNAIPQAGSVSFLMPVPQLGLGDVRTVISFGDSSPRDGSVSVHLGSVGPIPFKLNNLEL